MLGKYYIILLIFKFVCGCYDVNLLIEVWYELVYLKVISLYLKHTKKSSVYISSSKTFFVKKSIKIINFSICLSK
jgi:hypothetical protein